MKVRGVNMQKAIFNTVLVLSCVIFIGKYIYRIMKAEDSYEWEADEQYA